MAKTRQSKVIDYLRENDGASLDKVSELLGTPTAITISVLDALERRGKILELKPNRYYLTHI